MSEEVYGPNNYPIGRCNGCMNVKELVLEEMMRDSQAPKGPWMKMRWCQDCLRNSPLRQHIAGELNRGMP